MSAQQHQETKSRSATDSLSAGPGSVLQRKCSCGGSPGPSGECTACRSGKSLSADRSPRQVFISDSNDQSEKEATQIARRVMQSDPPSGRTEPVTAKTLTAGRLSIETPASLSAVLQAPGKPLPLGTRRFMETRFGHDFSTVRVHTGAQAAQSAADMSAVAYTIGPEVVFNSGRYSPESTAGRNILAHELAHVLQQSRAASPDATLLQRLTSPDCDSLGSLPFLDTVRGVSRGARSPDEPGCDAFSRSFSHPGGTVTINVVPSGYEDCDQDYSVQLTQCDLVFDNDIGGREVACHGRSLRFTRAIPAPGIFSGPGYYFCIRNGSVHDPIDVEITVR